jgi:cyanophycinase
MRPTGSTHTARPFFSLSIILALCVAGWACAPDEGRTSAGLEASVAAPSGPLFIVGGGPRPDSLMGHFLELAGGPGEARIAVVPMSSSDPQRALESLTAEMRALGAAEVVSLLLSRDEALSGEGLERLDGVTGIWFAGGVQTRHTEALKGTPVEAALHELLASGVVVGGTSAGAAIMSDLMITGDELRRGGDRPSGNGEAFVTIDRDNIVTEAGFGFFQGVIIDQHFVRRKRHNRLISLVLEHPHLVGIGIDEGTALEVHPDGRWIVRGESVVVVYDARDARVTSADGSTPGAAGLTCPLSMRSSGGTGSPSSATRTD